MWLLRALHGARALILRIHLGVAILARMGIDKPDKIPTSIAESLRDDSTYLDEHGTRLPIAEYKYSSIDKSIWTPGEVGDEARVAKIQELKGLVREYRAEIDSLNRVVASQRLVLDRLRSECIECSIPVYGDYLCEKCRG